MKLALLTFVAALAFMSEGLMAGVVRTSFEGARPLGMGNAYLALSDDANALWYNPAGLAYVKGVHINLFNFILGFDSTDTLNRLSDAVFGGNFNGLVRPDQESIRVSVLPNVIAPYFGISVYDNGQGFFNIKNLTLPDVDVYSVNDLGVIMGFGIPITKEFSLGASVRLFERAGVDAKLSVTDLINRFGVTTTNFNSAVSTYLQSLAGTGYGVGLNVGTLLKLPIAMKDTRLQLAATVEDVGQTSIHPLGGTNGLPALPASYNFGLAFSRDLAKNSVLNFTADLRNAFEDYPLFQKIHAGLEYRHKFFGLRAGYYQGYPTFGASVEFPPQTRLHFVSYAVEQGDVLWANGQRLYLFQVDIGFNPF